MKKLILIILSLVFFSTNVFANDARINEFTDWLIKNDHTQYLKENECKGCNDPYTRTQDCFEKDGKPKKQCWLDEQWKRDNSKPKLNLDIKFYKYNEIPEFSKPNKDTALYYLYRGQEVESINDRAGSTKSDSPYKFEIN